MLLPGGANTEVWGSRPQLLGPGFVQIHTESKQFLASPKGPSLTSNEKPNAHSFQRSGFAPPTSTHVEREWGPRKDTVQTKTCKLVSTSVYIHIIFIQCCRLHRVLTTFYQLSNGRAELHMSLPWAAQGKGSGNMARRAFTLCHPLSTATQGAS